jgi:hypothetical protein
LGILTSREKGAPDLIRVFNINVKMRLKIAVKELS